MLIAHVVREKGATVYTLAANATLHQAAQELYEKKVGALVVIDAEGAIIGVFSERDLVREVSRLGAAALSQEVGEAMSREVVTATVDETVDDGLARMTDRRVRHLPIVEDGVRLIGIISIGDLVKHRIAVAEAEAAAMQAYITAN